MNSIRVVQDDNTNKNAVLASVDEEAASEVSAIAPSPAEPEPASAEQPEHDPNADQARVAVQAGGASADCRSALYGRLRTERAVGRGPPHPLRIPSVSVRRAAVCFAQSQLLVTMCVCVMRQLTEEAVPAG